MATDTLDSVSDHQHAANATGIGPSHYSNASVPSRSIAVRLGTLDDVEHVLSIGRAQWDKLHTDPWNEPQMQTCVTACVTQPNTAMLVLDIDSVIVGAFGLCAIVTPCSGIAIAVKVFWFVDDKGAGHGMKLLTAAEAWAGAYGAHRLHIDAPTIGVERVLSRRGYDIREKIYAKDIPHV